MSFPRYPKYKDSGVEWLGEVPEHWVLKPLWTHFRRVKRTGFDGEELLSVYRDHGVVPKASRADNFNNPSEDLGAYQLVVPGDLAINKMKAWQGSVAISSYRGIVSPAYFVYEALHNANDRYLHYLMRSLRYITAYLSISKGIRINQWDLEPQLHSRLPLTVPPPDEQSAIASFLDRETATIDALIAEQERLIELLKEKRQAVISHAVTKGLNPDAPMKPSGVEWLGDVPAQWEVLPLKRIVNMRSGETIASEMVRENDEYPVFGGGGHRGYTSAFTHEGDFVLIGRQGALCGNVNYASSRFWASEHSVVVTPLRPLALLWLGEMIRSMNLNRYSVSAAQPGLSVELISRLQIPVPPLAEQESIASEFKHMISDTGALVAEADRAVVLLAERRSALISAAVTGQIDVRHLATAEAA